LATKTNLFIATPMYGGLCYGTYLESMLKLQAWLNAKDIEAYFSFLYNESLITRGRNTLVNDFLKGDATHLMFIDADIQFEAKDLLKMIDSDVEIICGLYPKKEINWGGVAYAIEKKVPEDQLKYFTGEYVVNMVGDVKSQLVPLDKPFEIKHGGTGFMLIKREVFEKLKDKCPSYTHNMSDVNDNSDLGDKITEYFATSIDEQNHLLSEDYHFCKLARDNGIKVWGAAWAQLGHTGTYQFSGRLV
jgi:hypothetical protein